jgi:glycosyltransferase involved in cell wall biosynthesis
MPAFNEEATVATAIERVLAAELPVKETELIVVENGSTDSTRAVLDGREWPDSVRVLHLDQNRGKGGAVRFALEQARGTYAAILDADLEYDAADLADLLPPLTSGDAEVVIGTRAFKSHSAYGFWYVVGGRLMSLVANVLFNAWLSDITCGLKAMPTDLMRSLPLRERGFSIDAEIPALVLRRGIRIYEVPISYRARSRDEGKKLTARDGMTILWTLARCRFS